MLSRFHPKKKWSKVFAESVEEQAALEISRQEERQNSLKIVMSKVLIAKRLGKYAKHRLTNSLISCRKTVENSHPPPPLLEWKPQWGGQSLCSLCDDPCFSEAISCLNCDSMTHYHCITMRKRQEISNGKLSGGINESAAEDDDDDDDDSATVGSLHLFEGNRAEYTCTACEATLAEDQVLYERRMEKLFDERKFLVTTRFIQRRIKVFLAQRRLERKKRAVKKIQRMLRRRYMRKHFFNWRRAQLRVMVFELTQISFALTDNHLVSFTVVDTIQHTQLFRFDKLGLSFLGNPVLLPGITAYMTAAVTVSVRREDPNNNNNSIGVAGSTSGTYSSSNNVFYPVCQAVLALRDVQQFLERRSFDLRFLDKILYPPQDHGESTVYHVVTNSSRASNSANNQQQLLLALTGSTGSLRAAVVNSSGSEGATAAGEEPRQCRLSYNPQNPIICVCAIVTAPPLDNLKKVGTEGLSKKNGASTIIASGTTRSSKWWLCLRHLRLYFYHSFGDPLPRYNADLRDVLVTLDKKKLAMALLFSDRKWILEFETLPSLLRFELAIAEGQKAFRETGGSIFIKSAEVIHALTKEKLALH